MNVDKILVPIDFSGCSRHATREALGLAKLFGAHVDLLHVIEVASHLVPDLMVTGPEGDRKTLIDFAEGQARQELQKLLDEVESSGVSLQTRLTPGHPRDAILEAADEGGYDLIVMGTHGRRGLSHLFIGSVAEQVVRRASCPVLTIRGGED